MVFSTINCTSFYGKRYQNLYMAVDDIPDNGNEVDIVVIPPDVDIQTDEEDICEDDLFDSHIPFDIPGEVELVINDGFESEDDIPLSNIRADILDGSESQSQCTIPKWSNRVMYSTEMNETFDYLENLAKLKEQIEIEDEVQIFEHFFNDEVTNFIIEQSQTYALGQNCHTLLLTKEDIKKFVGIMLFSGYHALPQESLYWCLDEDTRIPLVANAMSRNRFKEIKRFIHLANNSFLDKTDKMAKVRPFMNMVCHNYQQWNFFHEKLSIDEAMVKYFGHHSAKQFIRGKPVRFGYKEWMLCSSDGYCYSFDVYCGAKNVNPSKKCLPLGSRVVLDLLENVSTPSDHTVFFDNYFTSYDLLATLRKKGFRATGTVRDNRTKKCPLKSLKTVMKAKRGYFDHKFDKNNNILFARWKDNAVVTVATNYDTLEPLGKVKRWSSTEKEKVDISQPKPLVAYNKGMGGVDLHDQFVNNYRIKIKGKKWWWPLFTHMINSMVVNAWRLHCLKTSQNRNLLNFIRTIVRTYLRSGTAVKAANMPKVPKSLVSSEGGHFPKKIKSQLRCRICHNRARWACEKCQTTLCIEKDCFKIFHA